MMYRKPGKGKILRPKSLVLKQFTKDPDQVMMYLKIGSNGSDEEFHSYYAEHIKIKLCYLCVDEEHEERNMNPHEP